MTTAVLRRPAVAKRSQRVSKSAEPDFYISVWSKANRTATVYRQGKTLFLLTGNIGQDDSTPGSAAYRCVLEKAQLKVHITDTKNLAMGLYAFRCLPKAGSTSFPAGMEIDILNVRPDDPDSRLELIGCKWKDPRMQEVFEWSLSLIPPAEKPTP